MYNEYMYKWLLRLTLLVLLKLLIVAHFVNSGLWSIYMIWVISFLYLPIGGFNLFVFYIVSGWPFFSSQRFLFRLVDFPFIYLYLNFEISSFKDRVWLILFSFSLNWIFSFYLKIKFELGRQKIKFIKFKFSNYRCRKSSADQ